MIYEVWVFKNYITKLTTEHRRVKRRKRHTKVLFVTYCSRDKSTVKKSIPAIKRYKSQRIKYVYNLSKRCKCEFAILSGMFGLLEPEMPIPYYDHKMQESDIERVVEFSKRFISNKGIEEVIYFTKKPKSELMPYLKAVKKLRNSIKIKIRTIYLCEKYQIERKKH